MKTSNLYWVNTQKLIQKVKKVNTSGKYLRGIYWKVFAWTLGTVSKDNTILLEKLRIEKEWDTKKMLKKRF